jgi:hypothetical protein
MTTGGKEDLTRPREKVTGKPVGCAKRYFHEVQLLQAVQGLLRS